MKSNWKPPTLVRAEVILVAALEGEGASGDPFRSVVHVFMPDGQRIGSLDPVEGDQWVEGAWERLVQEVPSS